MLAAPSDSMWLTDMALLQCCLVVALCMHLVGYPPDGLQPSTECVSEHMGEQHIRITVQLHSRHLQYLHILFVCHNHICAFLYIDRFTDTHVLHVYLRSCANTYVVQVADV